MIFDSLIILIIFRFDFRQAQMVFSLWGGVQELPISLTSLLCVFFIVSSM